MAEYKVGLPVLKLSLHPSTQRNRKKAQTASIKKIWQEMCDDRIGRDPTIDRALTKDNVWVVGSTDMDVDKVIKEKIDNMNRERDQLGKRKLRKDSVSAFAVICKPPIEYMETLTREEQIRFLEDSYTVMASVIKDWSPQWEIIAAVMHFDEFYGLAGHLHQIVVPCGLDSDGCPMFNYNSQKSLRFLGFLNREYPARMREKGYPVLDNNNYSKMDEQEREAYKVEKKEKEYGMDAYKYKKKRSAELDAKIVEKEKHYADLSEKEERIRIRVLSKDSVEKMKKPTMTMDGKYYKVPTEDYDSLVATAGQVDVMMEMMREEDRKRRKELRQQEESLERREKEDEELRGELYILRKIRDVVEWLVKQSFVPEKIRKMLEIALYGGDISRHEFETRIEKKSKETDRDQMQK